MPPEIIPAAEGAAEMVVTPSNMYTIGADGKITVADRPR